MKRIIASTLMLVAVIFVVNVFADDTSDKVQAGISVLGGILGKKDNKQQARQENEQIPNGAKAITAQYSDFKWGISMSEARNLLRGKKVVEVTPPEGPIIQFEDTLFDALREVHLYFTPKSKKLYFVDIRKFEMNEERMSIIASTISKKYGESDKGGRSSDYLYRWGNPNNGDMLEMYKWGDIYSYNMSYSNAEMRALSEKEQNEIAEDQKNKISRDASKF